MTDVLAPLRDLELPERPPRSSPANRKPISKRDLALLSGTEGCDVVFLDLVRGDTVKIKPIRWLWMGYLAGGKLHILAGSAGIGKTTCATSLLATVTVGGFWPDGTIAPLGSVLIWSGEDDIADTLAPKLIAQGADMARVHFVGEVTTNGETFPFDPARHLDALQDRALRIDDLRLILVDPIVSAVAGDSHKNSEVRRGLAPLQSLAERTGAAVLGITHFTKGTQTKDPVERITGSLAFAAAARVVFVAAKRKDEGDQVFMRAKSNVGPLGGGFTYRTDQVDVDGHPEVTASIVRWTGSIDGEARDVLHQAEAFDQDGGSRGNDAKAFLRELLEQGAMEVDQVRKDAERAGHSWATVQRARQALGVTSRKGPGKAGKWSWAMPAPHNNI